MKWLKENIELSILTTFITMLVGAVLYVSSIKAKAESNEFRIEDLEDKGLRHEREFMKLNETVIETNTTVKNIEKYLIEKK